MLLEGRSRRNTSSGRTGFDCKQMIQHFVTDTGERSFCAAWLVMSSTDSFCAVSETFSTLMVNGCLASANGVTVLHQTRYDFISLCIVRNFVKRVEVARIEFARILKSYKLLTFIG